MLGQRPLDECSNIGLCVTDFRQSVWEVQFLHEVDDSASQHVTGVPGIHALHVGSQRGGHAEMPLRRGRGCEADDGRRV